MKRILVIGATGTVGAGITKALLSGGATVVAVGRHLGKLSRLAERFAACPSLTVVQGNIDNEVSAADLLTVVREGDGAIDAVVTSVNQPLMKVSIADISSSELIAALQANLVTHLVAAKTFLPAISPGGCYLSIGGGMADTVITGYGPVSMAQAALRMMMRHWAALYETSSVHVRELLIMSFVKSGGERMRGLSDEAVGRHVEAIVKDPKRFSGPILTLCRGDPIGHVGPSAWHNEVNG